MGMSIVSACSCVDFQYVWLLFKASAYKQVNEDLEPVGVSLKGTAMDERPS